MGQRTRAGAVPDRTAGGLAPSPIPPWARILSWTAFSAAATVTTWSVVASGTTRPGPWLVLAAVAVAVQHRDVVVVQRESAFDAGLAVAVTSVLVLGGHPGPAMAVGLLAGLCFLPQLRARSWTRLACNAGNFALSTLAAWCAAAMLPFSAQGIVATLAAASVAGCAYWVTNDGIGLVVAAARDRGVPWADARRVITEDARLLPLALLGGAVAWADATFGWWVLVALVVAPALVEQVVVGRRRTRRRSPRTALERGVLVAVTATAIERELSARPTPATVDSVLATAEAVVDGRAR